MFLLITHTDSNKFFSVSRFSRDFLGGLVAIFSQLSLGLATIFAAAAFFAKFSRPAAG